MRPARYVFGVVAIVFAMVVASVGMAGCGGAAAPAGDRGVGVGAAVGETETAGPAAARQEAVTRQEVVISLADGLIAPRFRAVAAEMSELNGAVGALCAEPTAEGLAAARTAWREARGPWLRSQAMWFGPVMDRRSRSLVDWWPIDPERIEQALAKRDGITAVDVREFFAATQRGLGAIEYGLFGDEGAVGDGAVDDGAVLRRLGESDGIWCQYLTALAEVIEEEMIGVRDEWVGAGDGRDYGGYFKGTAGVALLDQEAVDELVRTSVFLTRNIADMRLGKALGSDGGEPDPSAIPGGGGRNAVADLRNQVLGMQDVYLGAGGNGAGDGAGADSLGIGALVAGVSPAADGRMRGHFAALLDAIDGLEEPLAAQAVDNPDPVRVVQAQAQELQRALNTEVVSLLGVTVGFSDTDGDGG